MQHTLSLNESLSIFEENLPEIRQALLDNAQTIIAEHSPYKELDVDGDWSEEDIVLHIEWLYIQQHAYPMLNTIKRIDSYRYYTDTKNQNNSLVTDLDIANAREVSADWFIQEAGLSTRRPHVGLCFEHNDSSPSLHLMKSKQTSNHYLKCWVCDKTWNSIDLVMAQHNLSFIDAVSYINRN